MHRADESTEALLVPNAQERHGFECAQGLHLTRPKSAKLLAAGVAGMGAGEDQAGVVERVLFLCVWSYTQGRGLRAQTEPKPSPCDNGAEAPNDVGARLPGSTWLHDGARLRRTPSGSKKEGNTIPGASHVQEKKELLSRSSTD